MAHKCVTVKLVVGSIPIRGNDLFIFAFPRSGVTTQHAILPEFGEKWRTECLHTRFALPTLLCCVLRDTAGS